MTNALATIKRFKSWYADAALPLWVQTSWDGAHGGFFEALDFQGRPVRGPRRVRVQARQIYTFSRVGALGWAEGGETLASQGFAYLVDHACPEEGARGCVHVLSDDGAVLDDRRDLYDQAFILLACSARIEATGCRRAAAIAERVMAFLDRELASPHGGWRESDRGELPRRQNPHMHLFEAFMALERVTGDKRWRRRADAMAMLFDRYFFDRKNSLLREFFSEDWTRLDPHQGDVVEPGHMMEWIWLLCQYDKSAEGRFEKTKDALFKRAQRFAEQRFGFLPDDVNGSASSGSRRLWPQTEYVRAAFALASDANDAFAAAGGRIVGNILDTYADQPIAGLWCDRFDADGAPIAKDVPASILYHLYEAVAEADRFTERIHRS